MAKLKNYTIIISLNEPSTPSFVKKTKTKKSKKLCRTRTQFESIKQLYRGSGDSPKSFLKWINDPEGNTSKKSG